MVISTQAIAKASPCCPVQNPRSLAIDLCMSLCTDRLPLHVHAQIALAFGRCMKIAAELLFTSRAVQRLA